jgi:hypothetical protein
MEKVCKTCKYLDATPRYEHGVNFIATHWSCLHVGSDRFGDSCCNKTQWGKRMIDTRDIQTCSEWRGE